MMARRLGFWLLLGALSATSGAAASEGPLVLVGGGDTAYPKGWFDARARERGARMFEPIAPWLSGAHLRFLNLESPVTTRPPTARKTYPLTTHPHFLELLVDAGFNLFSLANNHTGDAGREGVADTLGHLARLSTEARPLWWSGAGADRRVRQRPATVTLQGVRVAMLAFRLGGSPLGNAMGSDAAERQIRAAAAAADFVVVSAHGGGEYRAVPGSWKPARWRRFIDAGAHVVLGHGPHNPQGVERYRGGVIYYSLGNLSFGTRPRARRTGGMLLRGLLARVTFGDGKIQRAEAVPLFVDNRVPWVVDGVKLPVRLFTPVPVTGPHAAAMLDELREWSSAIPKNSTRIDACGQAYCLTPAQPASPTTGERVR